MSRKLCLSCRSSLREWQLPWNPCTQ